MTDIPSARSLLAGCTATRLMPGDAAIAVAETGEAILVGGDAQNTADHRDFALAVEQLRDVLARQFARRAGCRPRHSRDLPGQLMSVSMMTTGIPAAFAFSSTGRISETPAGATANAATCLVI